MQPNKKLTSLFNSLFPFFLNQKLILRKITVWSKVYFCEFCSGRPTFISIKNIKQTVKTTVKDLPLASSVSPNVKDGIQLVKMSKSEAQGVIRGIEDAKAKVLADEQRKDNLKRDRARKACTDDTMKFYFDLDSAMHWAGLGLKSADNPFGGFSIREGERLSVVSFTTAHYSDLIDIAVQEPTVFEQMTNWVIAYDRKLNQVWEAAKGNHKKERTYTTYKLVYNPYQSALNYFNLEEGYTVDELKSAYRQLSKLHHPDITGDGGEMQVKINAYYEQLTSQCVAA